MSAEESELCADPGLEDGEIEDSDVEEGSYVPLARPDNFNPPSLINMQIQDEASDSADSPEDSSGSDSDCAHRPPRAKRSKIKPRRPHLAEPQKKKYDIWCTAVQEQVLTEDMVGCDVTKTRSLGVESYDYTIKYRLDDNYVSQPFEKTSDTYSNEMGSSNKRTHTDRKSVKLRLGKRENSHQEITDNGEPRTLANLVVTENDPVEDVAKDIAENLKEEKKDLLLRIVEVIGPGKAIELYKETKRVEEDGGILVMNGRRRRTPGGVYIFILKRDPWVSADMKKQMFHEERTQVKRERRRAQAAHRDHKVKQLKQTLDSELPALLSRSETTLLHSTEHGSNPPPSPATDARDCSSDTDTQSHTDAPPHPSELSDVNLVSTDKCHDTSMRPAADYDDCDFLEVNCSDEMDLF